MTHPHTQTHTVLSLFYPVSQTGCITDLSGLSRLPGEQKMNGSLRWLGLGAGRVKPKRGIVGYREEKLFFVRSSGSSARSNAGGLLPLSLVLSLSLSLCISLPHSLSLSPPPPGCPQGILGRHNPWEENLLKTQT